MAVLTLPDDHTARVNAASDKLKADYELTFQLTSSEQLEKADALVSQIGSVDWETEGYQGPEYQRDLSIKFHWGHNHRFADNFIVSGKMGDRHTKLMAEFQEGFDLPQGAFKDKDILDIGCWTGGTTLTLKMLGARRVLALEEVRKYADTTHRLATEIYGYTDVKCLAKSLYHLEEGKFDLVYIPGVVYHLSDPVVGLRRLFNRLKDGGEILVESAGIKSDEAICSFRGNQAHFGGDQKTLNRSGWAWFWPSAKALDMWLQEAGFEDTSTFISPFGTRVFGYGRRTKYRDITRAGLSVPDIE